MPSIFDTDPFWGEVSFFMSVSNIIFSVHIISTQPWNYWMFHCVKNFLYIAFKYFDTVTIKWQWFLVDFCYCVNYLSWLYFLTCYAKAQIPSLFWLRGWLDPLGPMLFKVAFTWSNGVLAAAVALFNNSMVFHSPKHMSILAVHIGPPIVTWAFRWYSEDLHKAWPDTFHTGCQISENCPGTVKDLIFIPMIFYLALWTIPYSLLVFVLMQPTIKAEGYVTMFSFYKDSIFKGKSGKYWINNERLQQGIYMSIHAVMSFATFGIAHLCWQSFIFHTAYLIFLLHVSIWNGAKFYFDVAMNKERILRNAAKEKAAKEAANKIK